MNAAAERKVPRPGRGRREPEGQRTKVLRGCATSGRRVILNYWNGRERAGRRGGFFGGGGVELKEKRFSSAEFFAAGAALSGGSTGAGHGRPAFE